MTPETEEFLTDIKNQMKMSESELERQNLRYSVTIWDSEENQIVDSYGFYSSVDANLLGVGIDNILEYCYALKGVGRIDIANNIINSLSKTVREVFDEMDSFPN